MRAVRLATVHIRLASITNQAPQILSQTIIMALTMFFSMDQLQPAQGIRFSWQTSQLI